jgi:hypothetical protein
VHFIDPMNLVVRRYGRSIGKDDVYAVKQGTGLLL